MSTKKYVENMIEGLSSQLNEDKKNAKKRNFLYNAGSIFTIALGVCFLGSQPWFAIPVMAFGASLQFTKKALNKCGDARTTSLIGQKEHLENMLKSGLDVKQEIMTKRKSFINKKEQVRKTQEKDYYSALSGHRLGSALVAGMAVVSGFVASPFVALGGVAALGVQHLLDKKFVEKNSAIEATCCEMNNTINDYNVAARVINNRAQRGTTTTRVNTAAKGSAATRVKAVPKGNTQYSQADMDAVDAYVRNLERQENDTKGRQKRKV